MKQYLDYVLIWVLWAGILLVGAVFVDGTLYLSQQTRLSISIACLILSIASCIARFIFMHDFEE